MEFRLDYATKANRMFDSSELTDELQALKGDVSRLLSTASDGIFDASKQRAAAELMRAQVHNQIPPH